MGVVWKARDVQLDREVAIKVLHDRYLGGDHQSQLVREARAMARLDHPNVVGVYDAGELEGRGFIAMELVRGEPLPRWLESPRTWQEVVRVFRGVAAGLASAHAAGILHRDIKPSNILIGDDQRPRLVDFGVAHASPNAIDLAEPPTATTAGLIGSPAYMTVSRLCGEPADAGDDQFGFCVSLYEALHGKRPFDAPTIAGTIAAIARGAPAPVRDIPRWLHAVIARGLAVSSTDRFPSMVALDHALAGPGTNRRRAIGIVVLGVAVAATAVVAIAVSRDREPAPVSSSAGSETIDTVIVQTELDAATITQVDDAATAETLDASMPATLDASITVSRDASVVRTRIAAIAPGPDAAMDEEVADDTTIEIDAGTPPAPRVQPPPDPRVARWRELRAEWSAALGAKDYQKSRELAEQAIPLMPEDPEARTIAATSSCHLGDEQRARTHLGKLPRSAGMSRIAVVKVCRRTGIELDDLLTELEAIRAR